MATIQKTVSSKGTKIKTAAPAPALEERFEAPVIESKLATETVPMPTVLTSQQMAELWVVQVMAVIQTILILLGKAWPHARTTALAIGKAYQWVRANEGEISGSALRLAVYMILAKAACEYLFTFFTGILG